ncbi:SDR family NAD(P)-dependent oxidoreductase [Microbacterium sp. zg.Y909]|uniref:SDR family NAD(P)-dependent oxidoreductase n=1 Tax=Microbacterium sp. zg.Y909 TaxID=2969413 RepID=UPI00214B8D7F|nr:SDR family oxidoreductase [Microbacterium sp. zg.Y909]MCR2824190.1 SDR family oxidoreductase [Microbacterium sp. zg.Y909]
MNATPVIDLAGRVAVITGAAGGQGRSHAALFHELGADLVLTDLDGPAVRGVAAQFGDRAVGLEHDVSSSDAWGQVAAVARGKFGRVDVLVNNAGFCPEGPLAATSERVIRLTLDVNLIGPMLGVQALLPLMGDGASIVNIASTAGVAGYANRVPYSASKWGLRGVSHALAREFAGTGIRVNTVCPGAVDTPMASEDARSGVGFITRIPIPRAGRPEEISNLVAYLASDASSYCTGQDFIIDGGQVA